MLFVSGILGTVLIFSIGLLFWNRSLKRLVNQRTRELSRELTERGNKDDILGKGDDAYAIPFYGKERPILIDLVMNEGVDTGEHYDFIEKKGNAIFGEVFVPNTYQGRGAYLLSTASPLFDKDGGMIGAIESIRDISDRKEAEKALRISEERFRAIFESAQECVFLKDLELKYALVNPAMENLFGLPASDLVGMTAGDFFDQQVKSFIHEADVRVLAGEVMHNEFTAAINGEVVTFHNIKVPIRDQNGAITGLCGIARDITKRKKAEEALKESEEQARFLSSRLLTIQEEERKKIAQELHDSIGQCFVAVKLNIESFLRSSAIPRGSAAFEQLSMLIPLIQNALVEARRIYVGLRPTVLDDLGIIATVHWICREFQKLHPTIGVEEHVDIKEREIHEPLKIVIFRVIQEALNNIVKHSRAEQVNLFLWKRNDHIELIIKDNGAGFDLKEALSREINKRGFGLIGMKERTELADGIFLIDPVVGDGTVIKASWPVREPVEEGDGGNHESAHHCTPA
jgi:PAS domain S-box-containing protein